MPHSKIVNPKATDPVANFLFPYLDNIQILVVMK